MDVGENLRPEELRQAANYLNTEFAGLPLRARPQGGAGTAETGAHALRRAALARPPPGAVKPRRAARRTPVVRRRRRLAARGRLRNGRRIASRRSASLLENDRREGATGPDLLNEYIDGPGHDRRHRARAPHPDLSAIQPGRIHLRRRPRRGHGRRHRPYADALFDAQSRSWTATRRPSRACFATTSNWTSPLPMADRPKHADEPDDIDRLGDETPRPRGQPPDPGAA